MSGEFEGQQLRRWQEDVARDPGSASFLPLADLYRREGRLDVARRLCQRGLERNPEHVEGHVLLGRILREQGDVDRAIDEFDIVLHLDPEHRAARRALGYLCLERRDWTRAVRHLEIAAASDARDDRVASALALARRHLAGGPANAPPVAPASAEPPPALEEALQEFVRESRVRFAMIIDSSGRIVLRHGLADDLDLAGFASLGAGVQSASRALAKLVGEQHFAQLVQGEGDRQLLIGTVPVGGGELILVAVLGSDATVGLVRVRFQETAREIAAIGWRPAPGAHRSDPASFDAELNDSLRRARSTSFPPS
jgi:predicted regulator of Ras-like GTPase activity (Roadblock/LC7/MglB family)